MQGTVCATQKIWEKSGRMLDARQGISARRDQTFDVSGIRQISKHRCRDVGTIQTGDAAACILAAGKLVGNEFGWETERLLEVRGLSGGQDG